MYALTLGARPATILLLFGNEVLRLAAAGAAIGLLLSLAAGGVLGSVLPGLKPFDILIYVPVGICLLSVAMLFGLYPARRASHFDPTEALREGG